MGRLSGFFADALMGLRIEDQLIGLPEIAIRVTATIGLRNAIPQPPTGGGAAIPDDERHDLACATAQSDPNPLLMRFPLDKRPQFVEF